MRFERTNPVCSFTVTDRVSVRKRLNYLTVTFNPNGVNWLQMWDGARTLIEDWQCEIMPDVNTDLDTIDDPQKAFEIQRLVTWAASEVGAYIAQLGNVPKN